MAKELTLIFFGADGEAAKKDAIEIRVRGGSAQLRHAYAWDGEFEPCDHVVLMPDVSEHAAARLTNVYAAQLAPTGNAVPPPPPFDPLADLGNKWRERKDVTAIAAAVAGRAVDDKAQAVAIIEEALKARTVPPPPAV